MTITLSWFFAAIQSLKPHIATPATRAKAADWGIHELLSRVYFFAGCSFPSAILSVKSERALLVRLIASSLACSPGFLQPILQWLPT